MSLTKEQKREYIKGMGLRCPYCNSNNIQGGIFQSDGDISWQDIMCLDCLKEWQDIYTLRGIEEKM